MPYLNRIRQLSANAPSSVLWFGSKNVTATDHFDVDNNFFWQLSGTKRFILTTTDAYSVFRPHCRFHPSWRQAQVPSSSDAHSAGRSLSLGALLTAAVPISYEVILNEGDLLYIPPMMFHTVTRYTIYYIIIFDTFHNFIAIEPSHRYVFSLTNSISLNIWSESEESSFERKLSKIDLPISSGNITIGENVAALANSIVLILRRLGRSTRYAVTSNLIRDISYFYPSIYYISS